jgi:transcriptional regulator with XRE-family HTH domain
MILAVQLRAARTLLGWSQKDLADVSGLSLPTIQRMETLGPHRSSAGNVDKVQRALETAGIEFIDEDAPGVRLRRPQSSDR